MTSQQEAAHDPRLREHTFDDIQEYDNYLPRWWLWTFYLACIFSIFYWMHYHGLQSGKSSIASYNDAVAELERKEAAGTPVSDESILAMTQKPALIAKGRETFEQNCAQCHNMNGGGGIGPNLTDNAWIHGGSPLQIYETVTKGVLAKGMPAWAMLGKFNCQQVAAYVCTLKNTNVAGGKAAEGTPESSAGNASSKQGPGQKEPAKK